MNNSRTSRPAIAGLVIAAAGGAIAATVLTLATVSFFTPDAWPGSSTGTAGETSAGKIVEPAAAASHALAQVQSASNGTLGSTPEALELAQLREALEQAQGERAQLSASLVTLNREVLALDVAVESLLSEQPEQTVSEAQPELAAEPDSELTTGPTTPEPRRGRGAIVENLLAAGLDPQTADELQRRQDAWQLERLDLIDLAAREGWADSERYDQELESLSSQRPNLREELGDDGWDRYLFEAGRRNRVSIASIIPGSAAETAGLQVGDQVLAYADTRVFVPNDLQQATQSGARGEAVALTVRRAGGFNQTLNVVRGPLGVTLARERSEP
jgi:hypothetical protein